MSLFIFIFFYIGLTRALALPGLPFIALPPLYVAINIAHYMVSPRPPPVLPFNIQYWSWQYRVKANSYTSDCVPSPIQRRRLVLIDRVTLLRTELAKTKPG